MVDHPKPRGRRAGQREALTTADLVVLSLLLERPMHGYDLLSEYKRQEVADWASISKAQLYYALNKLDGMGLLEGTVEDGARERMVYRPTEKGRDALAAGLADPSWARGRVPQPFTTWFGLSMHATRADQAFLLKARLNFLDEEIRKEKASLSYLEGLTDPRGTTGLSVVKLVIRQLEVEREWVSDLLASH